MRILQLDGLRAIAVFLVLLVHNQIFGYGWIGVDLFFVLSGFLITGILRKTRNDRFYWRSFYIKRVTRILPAMFLFLLLAAIELHTVSWTMGMYLLFLGNVAACIPGALPALGVLWSLAVEEHFYIFWPLFVKRLSTRRLINVCLLILVASPVLRFVATAVFHAMFGTHPGQIPPVFYLTPFRLDGLAAGALLAILCETPSPSLAAMSRWGLPVFLLSTFAFFTLHAAVPAFDREVDGMLFNTIGYSLVALMSAALVSHLVLCPASLVSLTLRLRPLVFIGQISYGVYLYHGLVRGAILHAIKVLHVPATSPAVVFCLDFVAAIGFATLSFYLLEKPIIAWGHRRAANRRVTVDAQAMIA